MVMNVLLSDMRALRGRSLVEVSAEDCEPVARVTPDAPDIRLMSGATLGHIRAPAEKRHGPGAISRDKPERGAIFGQVVALGGEFDLTSRHEAPW